MPLWLDQLFLRTVDTLAELRAAATPSHGQLAACRIISHRGERDDRRVFENTREAFDPLRGSGVHGIEFDVRWTRDLVPVVFHDRDLLRLFGDPGRIDGMSWAELRGRRPEIPDLHSFVRRYLDEFHLMVELKFEPLRDAALQNQRLCDALAPALERKRCHVLSLTPSMFGELRGIPPDRTLGVARLNTAEISREALSAGRAGIASHYLALRAHHVQRHHSANQVVGCGFPRSRAVLLWEIARGVDYIFTNEALRMERWRREALNALNKKAG
jgi:glycerophosphoryl diester phosphodiesterase